MAGADEELLGFVRSALRRDLSREQIRAALAKAGWPSDEIDKALRAYAEVDFPIPVPRPRPYVSARDAFIYLVIFATLAITAIHFGSLLFELIDKALPDALDEPHEGYNVNAVRQAIAALVVAFPIYVFLSYRVNAAIRRDPTKRSSRIRKWLTYLTLFIASAVLVGDLSTVIYSLLAGELTTRFILKALTVVLIAGAIFGYYLWDLRDDAETR
ncbi:MAG: DUF5671 domain-containing protein [Polyangiales bacterium]